MRIIGTIALILAAPTINADDGETARQSLVDLSESELDSITEQDGDAHLLSNPWWRNFDIYGFAAAGFYDTGRDATRPEGGFEIKEASLFVEAQIWEKVSFFLEFQTNRLGKDDDVFTRTGEVYIHFREVNIANKWKVGIKAGRIDIPFGEEYLWQDAIDNPLITNSAPYPYGWDEGLLLYGEINGWDWIAAITDGTDARSVEDNGEKAINLKVSNQITNTIYVSFSAMRNGDAAKSAFEFGGSHFEPVGASHLSTIGTSASTQVDSSLFQVDAKFDFSLMGDKDGHVALFAGFANQSDPEPGFDRDLRWFSVEPQVQVNEKTYLVARYSEIGTYDSLEGYHFDGKTFAGGNGTFGYDTERFRRFAFGAGWQPNPHVIVKAEIGKDWFTLIDASTIPNGGRRSFVGLELAVKF